VCVYIGAYCYLTCRVFNWHRRLLTCVLENPAYAGAVAAGPPLEDKTGGAVAGGEVSPNMLAWRLAHVQPGESRAAVVHF
jgi:hypothetical protein